MCSYELLRQITKVLQTTILVLFLHLTSHNINRYPCLPHASPNFSNLSLPHAASSLKRLSLDGHFNFINTHQVAYDFGNRYHYFPIAILFPKTVTDISTSIKQVYSMGQNSEVTITARGHGHSLQGQSQNDGGIVVSMESLKSPKMHVHAKEFPYIDVSGGELWINVLHETLKQGLAPKSWTDYLYLTVGGTLSNAGFSGQAFKHGPQINNVYQLEVVTGKGEIVKCSKKQNADLFQAVLGGLGQFGIITRARISLERAPKMVKWIRVLYSDFYSFTQDQEQLISSDNSFDYIEGFVIINRTGLVHNWRSTFSPRDPLQASQFSSEGKTLYCLEMAMYFDPADAKNMNHRTEYLLSKLKYMHHTLFLTEVSYMDFLNRVHLSEMKLQEKGLWDVPHPWLNLLVPKSKIHLFAKELFGNILKDSSNGPILIYPVNQSRWKSWNDKTSLVTPAADVFYLVAILSSAMPSSAGSDELQQILTRNKRILDFCKIAKLDVKQYLAHYETEEEWQAHFGPKWEVFAQRKLAYDPLAILAPGQRIFRKHNAFSS